MKKDNEWFTPDLEVTVRSLMKEGYNKVDSLLVLGKSNDDVTINYTFLNDTSPVYSRTLIVENIQDSISAVNWITVNQGIVYSDWEKIDTVTQRFFIKGVKSGIIFETWYRKNYLIIDFDLPDTNSQIRSANRKLTNEGVFLIGVNNNGEEIIIGSRFNWTPAGAGL
ncbi:MAG: hypothetical protein LPK03_16150 [Pontibacter sp.]|nr:hypothetical protein [Pontibacter sp.]